jgi:hypothetical protein
MNRPALTAPYCTTLYCTLFYCTTIDRIVLHSTLLACTCSTDSATFRSASVVNRRHFCPFKMWSMTDTRTSTTHRSWIYCLMRTNRLLKASSFYRCENIVPGPILYCPSPLLPFLSCSVLALASHVLHLVALPCHRMTPTSMLQRAHQQGVPDVSRAHLSECLHVHFCRSARQTFWYFLFYIWDIVRCTSLNVRTN